MNEIESHSGPWFLDKDPKNYLRPGDRLGIEVEMDPSFDASSYTIEWTIKSNIINEFTNKTKISFEIEVKHVGEFFRVHCTIISNKNWHKRTNYDDIIQINYKVLPPLNAH